MKNLSNVQELETFQVMTPLFTLKLSNAQVMFNKFDHFNVNNGVDANRV